MKINASFLQGKNNFFNVNAVNQGLNKDSVNTIKKGNRQDRVEMSPQGKMMSAIENLVKQKESIREQKSQLVSRTLEDGGNLKTIETQLELYEERLKDIDDQISEIKKNQMQVNPEDDKDKEKKTKKTDENKTSKQVETENLSRLANMADSVKISDVISSVKDSIEGKIRVKEAEQKLGSISIDKLESEGLLGAKVDDLISTIQDAIRKNKDEVLNLENKGLSVDMVQANNLGNITEKLQDVANTSKDEEIKSAEKEEEKGNEEGAVIA